MSSLAISWFANSRSACTVDYYERTGHCQGTCVVWETTMSKLVRLAYIVLLLQTFKSLSTEFRRHREVTNPVHIIGFLSQWKVYLDQLPRDADAKSFSGKRLDPTVFEKMSPEQLGQLYELMHATKDVWKPIPEEL
ncbi:hypothetical protein C0991_010976 [Blastosporella zonata]|nr:hypothetical protein C0991_010976 [Blastosporella zonata]